MKSPKEILLDVAQSNDVDARTRRRNLIVALFAQSNAMTRKMTKAILRTQIRQSASGCIACLLQVEAACLNHCNSSTRWQCSMYEAPSATGRTSGPSQSGRAFIERLLPR